MKWTILTLPCLLAMTLAACGGPRDKQDSGAIGGSETGAMTDTTVMDTATPGMADTSASADTSVSTPPSGTGTGDTGVSKPSTGAAEKNQSQSGVTDSSGQSTLGEDVTKTRADQSQPVTSKGDTLDPGVDSAR